MPFDKLSPFPTYDPSLEGQTGSTSDAIWSQIRRSSGAAPTELLGEALLGFAFAGTLPARRGPQAVEGFGKLTPSPTPRIRRFVQHGDMVFLDLDHPGQPNVSADAVRSWFPDANVEIQRFRPGMTNPKGTSSFRLDFWDPKGGSSSAAATRALKAFRDAGIIIHGTGGR